MKNEVLHALIEKWDRDLKQDRVTKEPTSDHEEGYNKGKVKQLAKCISDLSTLMSVLGDNNE